MSKLTLALLAGVMAASCSRSNPPATRPNVRPESHASSTVSTPDAGAAMRATPLAPPPPSPVTLSLAGNAQRVANLTGGRIDGLKLAALGSNARLDVDVVNHDERHTYVVTLAGGANPLAHADAPLEADDTTDRILSAAVAERGALHSLVYRQATPEETPHDDTSAGTVDMVGGAQPVSFSAPVWADEFVAQGDGTGFIAAAVGRNMECPTSNGLCDEHTLGAGSRLTEQEMNATDRVYYGQSGWGVIVIGPNTTPGLADPFGAHVTVPIGCDTAPTVRNRDEAPTYGPDVIPPFCRSARARAPDAVAVAYHHGGSAVAYRSAGALHLAVVGDDLAVHGPDRVIAQGQVGAPALAYRDGRFWMVWAQRPDATTPYALHYAVIDPTQTAAPADHTLATGTARAFAPGLAVHDDVFVLTWTEGDDHSARTRIAALRGGLDGIAEHAIDLSGTGVSGRDSEVAWGSDRGFVAWAEYPTGHGLNDGAVSVAELRLQ